MWRSAILRLLAAQTGKVRFGARRRACAAAPTPAEMQGWDRQHKLCLPPVPIDRPAALVVDHFFGVWIEIEWIV
jgi:hypothetical protein